MSTKTCNISETVLMTPPLFHPIVSHRRGNNNNYYYIN